MTAQTEETDNTQPDMVIDAITKDTLFATAKWVRVLAVIVVVVLIILALFLLLFLFADGSDIMRLSSRDRNPVLLRMVPVLLFLLGSIYQVYAMIKYASCMKRALVTGNVIELRQAFSAMKNLFKYIAICVMVFMMLYMLAFVWTALIYPIF